MQTEIRESPCKKILISVRATTLKFSLKKPPPNIFTSRPFPLHLHTQVLPAIWEEKREGKSSVFDSRNAREVARLRVLAASAQLLEASSSAFRKKPGSLYAYKANETLVGRARRATRTPRDAYQLARTRAYERESASSTPLTRLVGTVVERERASAQGPARLREHALTHDRGGSFVRCAWRAPLPWRPVPVPRIDRRLPLDGASSRVRRDEPPDGEEGT